MESDICEIIGSGALGKGWALRSINGKPLLHIAESFYQSTLCGQWAKTVELPNNQGRICKCCELSARTRYKEWLDMQEQEEMDKNTPVRVIGRVSHFVSRAI